MVVARTTRPVGRGRGGMRPGHLGRAVLARDGVPVAGSWLDRRITELGRRFAGKVTIGGTSGPRAWGF